VPYVRYVTLRYRTKRTDQRYVTVSYVTLRYVTLREGGKQALDTEVCNQAINGTDFSVSPSLNH